MIGTLDTTVKSPCRAPIYRAGMPSDFGHRLKKAREGKGWSQREFGRMIGATGATISDWESGKTQPDNIRGSLLGVGCRQVGQIRRRAVDRARNHS